MKITALLALYILIPASLFSQDQTFVIGREDRWEAVHKLENIDIRAGRQGFLSLFLRDGGYQPDEYTDLLISFEHPAVREDTGRYSAAGGDASISGRMVRLGHGAGVFHGSGPGILLNPSARPAFSRGPAATEAGLGTEVLVTPGVAPAIPGTPGTEVIFDKAMFEPGSLWRDFTIEFWASSTGLREGETLFLWQGNRRRNNEIVTQEIRAFISNRQMVWRFRNIFLPPDLSDFSLEIRGAVSMVPRTWYHHLIRFDSMTGLVETLLNGIPDGTTYASKSRREESSFYLPYIGQLRSGPVSFGVNYTGFMDEIRISNTFREYPFLDRYRDAVGVMVTSPIDLGRVNSRLIAVEAESVRPENSDIRFFYRNGNEKSDFFEVEGDWTSFTPGETFGPDTLGRFVQVRAEIFPDGTMKFSPELSSLTVRYEKSIPPLPPVHISGSPGDSSVTIQWEENNDPSIKGYLLFYGDRPGIWFGRGSSMGDSPIDLGKQNSVTIHGLENGKLYYFAVASYDVSGPEYIGGFSREISFRPIRNNGKGR